MLNELARKLRFGGARQFDGAGSIDQQQRIVVGFETSGAADEIRTHQIEMLGRELGAGRGLEVFGFGGEADGERGTVPRRGLVDGDP